MKNRILSGIQPSGQLHVGNYFGMIERMVNFQEESELLCFIANYHSLTSLSDSKKLERNTFEAFVDLLSLGIDPQKSIFWVQSHVPEVTELAWILSNFTSVGLMQRSTSYKDKISNGLKPNMGLFSYPVLMASDILLYQSNIVPVGKDQKQHLEMTKDIALKFNNFYGDTFIIPEAEIDKNKDLIIGIDGKKMSKSYNNTIPIFGNEKKIRKSIMRIITDNASINEPKDKETPLFHLYCLFADKDEQQILAEKYDAPGLRYGDIKLELFEKIMEYFAPFRKKRAVLQSKPDDIKDILVHGAKKAKDAALEVLNKVRSSVGLSFNL